MMRLPARITARPIQVVEGMTSRNTKRPVQTSITGDLERGRDDHDQQRDVGSIHTAQVMETAEGPLVDLCLAPRQHGGLAQREQQTIARGATDHVARRARPIASIRRSAHPAASPVA